jgi:putative oxidoreductase
MTQHTAFASTTVKTRTRGIALWTLQIVGAGLFLVSGSAKFIHDPTAITTFERIGAGDWLMYFVGACEIAGAVGLLVPVLTGLAATAFIPLMIGAIITQATVMNGPVGFAAGVLVAVAVIAWYRRDSLPRLWALVTSQRPQR